MLADEQGIQIIFPAIGAYEASVMTQNQELQQA